MPLTQPKPLVPVLQQLGIIVAATTTATAWFDAVGTRTPSATGTATARPFLTFAATDWPGNAVGNLQVSVASTAAQTGVTFTFGLYPIANTGTTTTIPTLGTVVTGSTVAFVAPGSASELQGNSGNFALPAADLYMIGCVNSATTAASSLVQFTAVLRMA